MTSQAEYRPTNCEIAALLLTGTAMLLFLKLHLLPALLSGLLVFEIVNTITRNLRLKSILGLRVKLAIVAFMSLAVIAVLASIMWGLTIFFRSEAGSIPVLIEKMADIIEGYRAVLPVWVKDYIPADTESLKTWAVVWLKNHAHDLESAGREAGFVIVHILIGMALGALISLREVVNTHDYRPLEKALAERISLFGRAFSAVIMAQVRIALLNALFAALYLGILLPLFGVQLPLVKTMVAITFVASLLPVIGNVISNTVIVVVSMSHSLAVAAGSFAYLVTIHKLEYFMNARIIGARINARAWELLIAMLFMEAAFGISGVIAAPIYYAYIKSELRERDLV